MNSAADIWARVLSIMEETMTKTTISTWFSELEPIALEESRFILYGPSDFTKEVVKERYFPDIKRALYDLFSVDLDVVIFGKEERDRYVKNEGPTRFLPNGEGYTFERFVVGNSNKFAHAAAMAVADRPGEVYNPLFLYGESGLGKTHLLYAVAHAIHKDHPNYKIVYIRGDSFTNELIQAIREGKNQEFRDKYRTADVFLMDDVQFIAGRDSTQEEMFHTFNALYEEKKQLIFTSDRPPKEMLRLEDRLKTRFEWGLLADIQPPDYETRMAIIKAKAMGLGVQLPEEVLTYVAENITSNVRQLEGTVNKILAFRDLMGGSVDAKAVTEAVRVMFKDTADLLPTANVIIEEVCKFYNIEEDALRGQSRTKETSQARQIAMFLIRSMTKLSLKDIGKEFQNRDHTTVIHSIDRIEKLSKSNPEIAEVIKDIRSNVNDRYD
ncbi:MAG: chromosomal replication initiator protein DnaA [Ruminiclostridium sp.]|nr:chromosomal replication initiator protein DnaA [Ruminiclostridium sp.]